MSSISIWDLSPTHLGYRIGLADRAVEFVRGFPPLTWSCTLMRWGDSWLVFSDAGIGEPLCLDSAGAVGSGRAEEEKNPG